MATSTRYNKNIGSPAVITDELYTSTGSGENILGDQARAFKGSTLVIRTASGGGGTLLVEDTDYDLVNQDSDLTIDAGFPIYAGYQITNVTYQTGNLYFSYDVIGTYTDADIITELEDDIATNTTELSDMIGVIFDSGASAIPSGFLDCDGAAVSRTTYADLFAVISTTWGVGDGSTTFNVPDLRGMFLRGTGTHGTLTMADSNSYAGPSVASSENDLALFHVHGSTKRSGTGGTETGDGFILGTTWNTANPVGDPIAGAGGFGTPRTGDENRPVSFGIKHIIKY